MNRRLIVLLVIGIGVLFGLTGCTFTNPAILGPPCDSNAPRCGDDCCKPPNMCVDGKCKGPLIALKPCTTACEPPKVCVNGECVDCVGHATACKISGQCCAGFTCGGELFLISQELTKLCCAGVVTIKSNGQDILVCCPNGVVDGHCKP
jgi:hypothetical protein